MAHEIAAEIDSKSLHAAPLEARLERVTGFLNERGYLAHWEHAANDEVGGEKGKHEDGYRLHKCNCPYAGVATVHPELCLMDQALIDELMGQPCRRTQSMVENAHCCTYHIDVAAINVA